MKATEYCAAYLRERGIRRVYGIPGIQSLDLVEALYRAGIQFVLTHHEAAAGYMATVESQLTGVPGVCLVDQGAGTANITAAVANAELDRSPLVVLATTRGRASSGVSSREVLPLLAAFDLTAKWAAELTAANVRHVLPSAFEQATAPRAGPVFLALSTAEGRKSVDDRPRPVQAPLPVTSTSSSTSVEMASARLREFRRPALLAGTGVLESRASASLRRLAERLGAPVAVTPRAKGQFPEDHPLFLGTLGARADAPIRELLNSADLVLLVGLDEIELQRPLSLGVPTISLAHLGAEDVAFVQPGVSIEGDLQSSLEALAGVAVGKPGWDDRELRSCREAVLRGLAPKVRTGLSPQIVARLLREEMSRETIVTCGRGAHSSRFCQAWSSYEPSSFLTTLGLSAVGFGLPAGIAAKLVFPDRPVVAITGDSGLLMYLGECWSVIRLQLPVIVVVMADGGIASVRAAQVRRGNAAVGVDFGDPDYASFARGFGFRAARVSEADSLRAAVHEAAAAGVPFLIHADINSEEYL